ncbi:MAG: S53 family peptidase [Nitrosopumilaceae archaeon]
MGTRTAKACLIGIILFSSLVSTSLSTSNSFAYSDNSITHGPPDTWQGHPPIHIKHAATLSPTGLLPAQIRHAYGFDQLTCSYTGTFGDPNLCGTGQTIAIVDAYDDPNIQNDLTTFSNQFGLPACTSANGCFVKATTQGKPRSDQGWALEESLDVQWAHAMAPGAKIILVESKTASFSNLLSAVDYAVNNGANQVSMSWGGSEFSSESSYDYHFNKNMVSFFASSGDSGSGTIYPSVSPYVVAVGGTTLNVDSSGNVSSETAWSGSGGGKSLYESEQSYQTNYGILSNAKRAVPDVSYNGDPNTGVPVYDSFGYQGSKGWFQVGGTSAGAPQWAALSAITNSARTTPMSSTSFGTDTLLYGAATGTSYGQNYRDVISGSNGGFSAGTGYDFVTGVGSPLSISLIHYLQTH